MTAATDGAQARTSARPQQSTVWAFVAGASLIALLVGVWLAVHAGPRAEPSWRIIGWTFVCWLVFAIGAFAVMRTGKRAAVWLILLGGVALQVVAMTAPPSTSTDYYRYVWDGRVQAAGISPYEYIPPDPALAELRDPWLFPPGNTCPADGINSDCPIINYPYLPTIYPPVAEAYFFGVHLTSPNTTTGFPLQLAAGLIGIGTTVAILVVARARGSDLRRAVLWSWCPLVVIELGNNAHVDGLGSILVVAALGCLAVPVALSRRRAVVGGALLGLSIAVKILPVLLMPSVIRRKPFAVALAALAAIVVVYIPHLLMVGDKAAGSLSGYADANEDGRFAVLKMFMPDAWATPAAVGILFATGLWALWRSRPQEPWMTAAATVGITFIVLTPAFQWYALLLVPLVAMGARATWLVLPVAMTVLYFEPDIENTFQPLRGTVFLAAAVFVAAVAIARCWRERDTGQGPIEPSSTEQGAIA